MKKNKRIRIAIRADGGSNIGIGHIERCLILAQQLRKNGDEIFFICKQDEKIAKKIRNEEFRVLELLPDLTLEQDLQQTLLQLKAERTQIVITDSYAIGEHYLNELINVAKLITIDDLAQFPFPSDIVVNQNIYAEKLEYRSSTDKTKFLLGPKFALLRPEYSNLKRRAIRPEVKKILVTLGGADFHNLTPRILKILSKIKQDFIISVIVGTFFDNLQQITKTAREMRGKMIRPIRFTDKFYKILLQHDLAITGGGSTTYTLAAAGIPTLSFCLADNQKQNIQSLANYGTLINLGWGNKTDEANLEQRFSELIGNFRLRKRMAKLGRALVDGRGAKRVCSVIRHEVFTDYEDGQGRVKK